MCDIIQKYNKLSGGGLNLDLTCAKSGKPITVSNEWGMFCEDLCDLEESKQAGIKLKMICDRFAAFCDPARANEVRGKDPAQEVFKMFDEFFGSERSK